jgi:penicillin-binding protein 2
MNFTIRQYITILLLAFSAPASAQVILGTPKIEAIEETPVVVPKTSSHYPSKVNSPTVAPPATHTAPETLPTTFVPRLQALGKQLLKGRTGSIVAIDPSTGEVLCLVTNSPTGSNDILAIATAYPPGSTIKVAQALTQYSEGVINASTTIGCTGEYRHGNIRVGCHKHRSPLHLQEALALSCNTWFLRSFTSFINSPRFASPDDALAVWRSDMQSMGLGGPVGIDMQGELGGLLPTKTYLARRYPNGWNAQTIMWAGMGQGDITVTPLQLCNLAASIANRGYFYTPHIHHGTAQHPLSNYYTQPRHTTISQSAYSAVIAGMRDAVLYGTLTGINTRDYAICGKTGTAENFGKDHSAFIGFAPMNHPRIAISVYIEHAGFGADVAAPIASRIIRAYIMNK